MRYLAHPVIILNLLAAFCNIESPSVAWDFINVSVAWIIILFQDKEIRRLKQ
ncbi:MAG: hypothetical protein ACLUGY_08540 [Phocaeicola massiliensis]